MPYEHLFDYLDNRSSSLRARAINSTWPSSTNQIKKHPDQPAGPLSAGRGISEIGKVEDARNTIAQLDKISAGDYRTLTGTGVLLARYHLYDDAIQHFQAALQSNPDLMR